MYLQVPVNQSVLVDVDDGGRDLLEDGEDDGAVPAVPRPLVLCAAWDLKGLQLAKDALVLGGEPVLETLLLAELHLDVEEQSRCTRTRRTSERSSSSVGGFGVLRIEPRCFCLIAIRSTDTRLGFFAEIFFAEIFREYCKRGRRRFFEIRFGMLKNDVY